MLVTGLEDNQPRIALYKRSVKRSVTRALETTAKPDNIVDHKLLLSESRDEETVEANDDSKKEEEPHDEDSGDDFFK